MVLGTGLGGVTGRFAEAADVPFAELPGFPAGAVTGHAKRVSAGRFAGRRVVALEGRGHYYETGDAGVMRVPMETLAALGVRIVVLTNAAGSLRADMPPGSLMLIADHINLTAANPLIGEGGDERFVGMVDAYDPALRRLALRVAAARGIALAEGVYMWFPGPSFETPAEIRAARVLGADAVGMSTVPETIIARRLGLRVVAISVLTNFAAGVAAEAPTHAEAKAVAGAASEALGGLLEGVVEALDDA
ncbi:MAG: purine-nucleoside phosphorylase [Rhodospirillaceae bacterium]|nr:purine-nucleoside phosphorylase [Rhodospirillaceae bacterium]